MREIKFRAWDKDRKCFLPCIAGNTDINDDKWICPLTYCEVRGVWDWYNNDTCEVMQYTGLKDRNKKEIYEGDIVAYMDGHDDGYYGECSCVGQVVWDEETLSFQLTNRIEAESYECLEECEVIGNIYENENLLEGGVKNEID